jgi:flagellar FliL protein
MNKSRALLLIGSILLIALVPIPAWSEDEAAEESTEGESPGVFMRPIYVPVKPAFVINYGGNGKLQYMKIEISLRVEDASSANAARHHMPLVRDALVKLFSRQTDADIDTPDGKERLRLRALKAVQDMIMEEDGEQGVINLFFSHFVVQK